MMKTNMCIWKLKKLKAKKLSKTNINIIKQKNFMPRQLKIIIHPEKTNGFNSFKILKDRTNSHRYLIILTLLMVYLTFPTKILH